MGNLNIVHTRISTNQQVEEGYLGMAAKSLGNQELSKLIKEEGV